MIISVQYLKENKIIKLNLNLNLKFKGYYIILIIILTFKWEKVEIKNSLKTIMGITW